MSDNTASNPQIQDDEITLKELIKKIEEWIGYFLSKWHIILIALLVGGILGFVYVEVKEINYKASINFIMEDQGSARTNLGSAAGIAAQLGLNLGGIGGASGGFFQGDNIIEFLKSRSMINRTLFTEVEIKGKRDLIVHHYIDLYELREKWKKREKGGLENIQFVDTIGIYTQDSLMNIFYKSILKNNLTIQKPDRKLNIIQVTMATPNPLFSKVFVETLIDNASDFYIKTRTQKANENLALITQQVDSVRRELNAAIGGVAAANDANPNPNRAFQTLRVGAQLRTVDVQANTAILTELVRNQELARITLRNEKPVIQTLDGPILPLDSDSPGMIKTIIIGGFLGAFIVCLILLVRRIYRQIMAEDELVVNNN